MKIKPADESLKITTKHASNNALACPGVSHETYLFWAAAPTSSGEKIMRRTMKNFAKVIEKKERAAWLSLNSFEEKYGKESVVCQKALSEWAALYNVMMMLESKDFFDTAYEIWIDD